LQKLKLSGIPDVKGALEKRYPGITFEIDYGQGQGPIFTLCKKMEDGRTACVRLQFTPEAILRADSDFIADYIDNAVRKLREHTDEIDQEIANPSSRGFR